MGAGTEGGRRRRSICRQSCQNAGTIKIEVFWPLESFLGAARAACLFRVPCLLSKDFTHSPGYPRTGSTTASSSSNPHSLYPCGRSFVINATNISLIPLLLLRLLLSRRGYAATVVVCIIISNMIQSTPTSARPRMEQSWIRPCPHRTRTSLPPVHLRRLMHNDDLPLLRAYVRCWLAAGLSATICPSRGHRGA